MTKTAQILWGTLTFVAVFVVGLIVGEGLPRAYVETLDHAGIVLGYVLSCLAGMGILLTVLNPSAVRRVLSRFLPRRTFEGAGKDFEVSEHRVEAVVVPVSDKTTVQPDYILCQLKPKQASLLYTERSQPNALSIVRNPEYKDVRFHPNESEIKQGNFMIREPTRPSQSKAFARYFIERFLDEGIQPENIFVDTTGGTVPISIGAFQAAEEMGVSSIYVIGWITDPKDPEQADVIFISRHTPSNEANGRDS